MIATMRNFTDQQRKAIDTRHTSVSLSAGAGCGKTFVLTERFLSHLEPDDPDAPPVQLHELIAITFTDRAAREMRDRIQKKCYERLQAGGGRRRPITGCGCCAAWIRRGSARSIRFAAPCCAPMPWKRGSIRGSR